MNKKSIIKYLVISELVLIIPLIISIVFSFKADTSGMLGGLAILGSLFVYGICAIILSSIINLIISISYLNKNLSDQGKTNIKFALGYCAITIVLFIILCIALIPCFYICNIVFCILMFVFCKGLIKKAYVNKKTATLTLFLTTIPFVGISILSPITIVSYIFCFPSFVASLVYLNNKNGTEIESSNNTINYRKIGIVFIITMIIFLCIIGMFYYNEYSKNIEMELKDDKKFGYCISPVIDNDKYLYCITPNNKIGRYNFETKKTEIISKKLGEDKSVYLPEENDKYFCYNSYEDTNEVYEVNLETNEIKKIFCDDEKELYFTYNYNNQIYYTICSDVNGEVCKNYVYDLKTLKQKELNENYKYVNFAYDKYIYYTSESHYYRYDISKKSFTDMKKPNNFLKISPSYSAVVNGIRYVVCDSTLFYYELNDLYTYKKLSDKYIYYMHSYNNIIYLYYEENGKKIICYIDANKSPENIIEIDENDFFSLNHYMFNKSKMYYINPTDHKLYSFDLLDKKIEILNNENVFATIHTISNNYIYLSSYVVEKEEMSATVDLEYINNIPKTYLYRINLLNNEIEKIEDQD